MRKVLKIFFIIIIFILSTIVGFTIYMNEVKKNTVNKMTTLEDLKELSKSVGDERINILLLGVDNLDSNQNHANMRTDTMMLLSVDPKTKTAFILSIPRDTGVEIDGYKPKFNKINSAHSLGGVDTSIKAVKKLLGVDIHHFVKIDYQALSKTVDDIGGVEVYVPMDMNYEDPYANPPLKIQLKEGVQVLDGDKAMQFLRFRYGYANQDLGRIESQQKFMSSLIKKVLSVESAVHIPEYIETFYKYVQTDMSFADMLKIASKCIDLKLHNIKKEVLLGEADIINEVSYYITDKQQVQEQVQSLMSGNYYTQDVVYEATSKDGKQSIPYVVILNGNGRQGLAQRAKDLLVINNIEVQDISNADGFDYKQTVVYYKDSEEDFAKQVAQIIGATKIAQENKAYYGKATDILIVLGEDFIK